MPSAALSRRRLLAAAGGYLSVALAGCTGEFTTEPVNETSTGGDVERPERGSYESTHDYEVLSVRASGDELFVFQDEDTAREVEETPDGEPLPINATSILFVLDEGDADDLWIETEAAGTADGAVADDIRAFVEETDFETASIVIDQRSIGDCYYRRVRGVQARDDEFRVDYCRRLKAPTTPCEADRDVMEAVVFRVKRAYGERPSRRGSSWSMSCRGPVIETDDTSENATAGTEEGGR